MAIYYAKEISAAYASYFSLSDTSIGFGECWVQGHYVYPGWWKFRSFLKYNLSGIPYKSVIKSAKLRLRESWKNSYGDDGTTNIARVTEVWTENELTWNNMPASEGEYLSTDVCPPGLGNWTDWDITTLVQEWVDQVQPNYGLQIVNRNEGGTRNDWKFYNRRYDFGQYATYIEIEYEPEPECRITQLRLGEIADQVRRITGTTDMLTPAGIVDALKNITV